MVGGLKGTVEPQSPLFLFNFKKESMEGGQMSESAEGENIEQGVGVGNVPQRATPAVG